MRGYSPLGLEIRGKPALPPHWIEGFHAEKDALYAAGLRSSPWQGSADTATSVDSVAQHCHIVGNSLSTAYLTRPAKDRLTIIDVLRNGQTRQFLVNEDALDFAAQ